MEIKDFESASDIICLSVNRQRTWPWEYSSVPQV
jgi:hypothetical protein